MLRDFTCPVGSPRRPRRGQWRYEFGFVGHSPVPRFRAEFLVRRFRRIDVLDASRGRHMVSAFVLLKIERTQIEQVADKLASLKHVSEVYSVSGRYDLIAIVRVASVDDLSTVVTQEMLRVQGITHSETMLAFRAYSRHDLERLFSIGAEDG
jgi:DNA-binding Lrp family transcriptional regulator